MLARWRHRSFPCRRRDRAKQPGRQQQRYALDDPKSGWNSIGFGVLGHDLADGHVRIHARLTFDRGSSQSFRNIRGQQIFGSRGPQPRMVHTTCFGSRLMGKRRNVAKQEKKTEFFPKTGHSCPLRCWGGRKDGQPPLRSCQCRHRETFGVTHPAMPERPPLVGRCELVEYRKTMWRPAANLFVAGVFAENGFYSGRRSVVVFNGA